MWLKVGALAVAIALTITGLLFVRSSQRSILVVAQADIPIVDMETRRRHIGVLPTGQTRQVLWCVDNKHYIAPVVELEPGVRGFPEGHYRIVIQDTGPLSRPQFLGCGDE